MGYYVITILIKRKDNMSNETMRETIKTIKDLNSMKAVKVAFDLSQTNMDSITKVTEVVSLIDNNLKLLATKVLELEQRLNVANKGIERIDERSTSN